MPWTAVKDHPDCGQGKWAVVKDSSGEVEGCHASEAAAQKQISALYASEPSGHSYDRKKGGSDVAAVERRYTQVPVELRAGGEHPKIGGYAAVFDRPSQNLGGFIEAVRTTFFNKSRGDGWPDVMARYNHEDNMLLGTTAAGTLQLGIDNVGLSYEVLPPKSRSDVLELVERGDVRKSSFAFRVPTGGDDWALSDQGYPMRSLISGQLIDVAPVNKPAYSDTTAHLRALEDPDRAAAMRDLGLGPEAALRSLALKMSAEFDEVREAALANELRKFFVRTDNRGPAPKARAFGPVAAAALLARRADPWE